MEAMCPEPGLISAYVDGEVPSPWKERLAAHLAVCPACAERAASYEALRKRLSALDDIDVEASVERVRARLGESLNGRQGDRQFAPADAARGDIDESRGKVWHRRLAVPLPLVAAAAAAMLFFAGLAASGLIHPAKAAVQTLAAAEIAPSQAQPTNMEALVKYLEAQDAQVNVTIQLPSGATFDSSGKPLVVKAEDAAYTPLSANGFEGSGH
jgi:anti-sigma factor RsiW